MFVLCGQWATTDFKSDLQMNLPDGSTIDQWSTVEKMAVYVSVIIFEHVLLNFIASLLIF